MYNLPCIKKIFIDISFKGDGHVEQKKSQKMHLFFKTRMPFVKTKGTTKIKIVGEAMYACKCWTIVTSKLCPRPIW
jgi:hypothetical protein